MSGLEARFDFDGEYGERYDAVIRRVFPAYDQLFPIVLGHLSGLVSERARVLVVGAGTGSEMVTFAAHRPGWRLTGVEPSSQMAAACRARLREQRLEQRCTLHRGYTHELPADERFDAATAICVLHFLTDDGSKLALLTDIATRLVPGAPLALVDGVGEPGTPAFDREAAAWMRYVMLMGMSDAERLHYREQVRSDVRFVSEERVLTLLEQAGFESARPFFRALVFRGWIALRAHVSALRGRP